MIDIALFCSDCGESLRDIDIRYGQGCVKILVGTCPVCRADALSEGHAEGKREVTND